MKTPTIQQIIKATSKVMAVPVEVLTDPAHRARNVTEARHIAQHLCRASAFKSWPEITHAFNQKHPTAYTGAKKIEKALTLTGDESLRLKRLIKQVAALTAKE